MQRLNDYCTCEAKLRGDEFVGIRNDGCLEICFPAGYFKNDAAIEELDEDELRQDIMQLFDVLSDSELFEVHENSNIIGNEPEKQTSDFPMRAYVSLLRNFMEQGYYSEQEVVFRQGGNGRVDWNRTIKTLHPDVVNDSVVYLDPITRQTDNNEQELISLIHKYCVWDAAKRIGFVFDIDIQEPPTLDFDYEVFSSVLMTKASKTFHDRTLTLFQDMQRIVEYLGKNVSDENVIPDEFYFGVNSFAPVWEAMMERIFATERREDYYPNCGWVIDGKNAGRVEMRPDTIMKVDDNIFVLDSKYYTYGVDGGTLPQSESITKQLAYAEFAESKTGLTIYNAFLMPYCSENFGHNLAEINLQTHSPFMMKYLGYAYSDWKNTDVAKGLVKPYHKIHGILLDIKTVMQNYGKNNAAQKVLANIITHK